MEKTMEKGIANKPQDQKFTYVINVEIVDEQIRVTRMVSGVEQVSSWLMPCQGGRG